MLGELPWLRRSILLTLTRIIQYYTPTDFLQFLRLTKPKVVVDEHRSTSLTSFVNARKLTAIIVGIIVRPKDPMLSLHLVTSSFLRGPSVTTAMNHSATLQSPSGQQFFEIPENADYIATCNRSWVVRVSDLQTGVALRMLHSFSLPLISTIPLVVKHALYRYLEHSNSKAFVTNNVALIDLPANITSY